MFIFIIVFGLMCTGCTYNISMAHTEGTATDVIDDTATPTANPNVNVSGI